VYVQQLACDGYVPSRAFHGQAFQTIYCAKVRKSVLAEEATRVVDDEHMLYVWFVQNVSSVQRSVLAQEAKVVVDDQVFVVVWSAQNVSPVRTFSSTGFSLQFCRLMSAKFVFSPLIICPFRISK